MMMSLISGFDFIKPDVLTIDGAAAVLFYFTVYSLMGWLLENSYSLATTRKFLKPNFLYGPFKPMYGFAPLLLVYLTPQHSYWWVVLLLCLFIPTMVEYLSGALLQKLFQRQWWDYSSTPMQLHGHICLPFSLCWFVLSLVCLNWIHPAISVMYESVETYWGWIWSAVGLYLLADLTLSIRKHSTTEEMMEEVLVPDTKLE